jgi:hypothetical protein
MTMRSSMMIASAALTALGLSTAYAADNAAPNGTAVEQSSEGKGATTPGAGDKMPPMGEKGTPSTGTAPGGSGVEESAEGKGATDKGGTDKMAPMGDKSGASSGTAPGGTGVEKSSEGEGAKQKN